MELSVIKERFKDFRQRLYDWFPKRADSSMDLIDALSSNTQTDSVVKLSLNPLFRRSYNSISDAITNFLPAPPDDPNQDPTKGPASNLDDKSLVLGNQDLNLENQIEILVETQETHLQQEVSNTTTVEIPVASSDFDTNCKTGVESATKLILNEHSRYLAQLIASICSGPSQNRPFYLFATDCTSAPRPFARTLADRSIVYAPNPAPGNRPVKIGHKYSLLVLLPEITKDKTPPWVLPISMERVPSLCKGNEFGIEQLNAILNDPKMDFKSQLCVVTGDTLYSSTGSRRRAVSNDNLVLIARIRNNRNVYFQPITKSIEENPKKGHPKWYGDRMKLNDESTHQPPNEKVEINATKRGNKLTYTLESWDNMLLRSEDNFDSHKHPFTLIKVSVTDETDKKVFKHPMWLMVDGKRRHEISTLVGFECYQQRYDIEHFIRFGKQRLLLDKFQTPDVSHEENWWKLVGIAYTQLYLCRELANKLPYPWERSLPENQIDATSSIASPSQTQRDFFRIVEEIGTPAKAPKKRGLSKGRKKGDYQRKRQKKAVIYKKKQSNSTETNNTKGKPITKEFEKPTKLSEPLSYSEVMDTLKELLPTINMDLEEFLTKAQTELSSP